MSQADNIKSPPLREIIYQQMVDDITHGRINAGERLSEASLCERFSVSKTPIREALIQMEREGFVLLKKNVGAVVQKISKKVVGEVLTVVAVLESYALESVVAGGNIQKSEILNLTKLVETMGEHSKQKRYLEYRPLNLEFHGFFVEKLGNETLKKSVLELRRRMYSFVSVGLTVPMHIDRYVEWHKRILEAVKQDNAAKAATLMRDHVMESKRFLLDSLMEIR
jgi:DNA-binding GntR family transcriptional regulator